MAKRTGVPEVHLRLEGGVVADGADPLGGAGDHGFARRDARGEVHVAIGAAGHPARKRFKTALIQLPNVSYHSETAAWQLKHAAFAAFTSKGSYFVNISTAIFTHSLYSCSLCWTQAKTA